MSTHVHSHIIHKRQKSRNNPNAQQWMNGYIKCGVSTKQNIIQPWKGKVLVYTTTRMNLKNIRLSERSQLKGLYIIWCHLNKMFRIGKFIEMESRLVVAKGWRRGEWESTANGMGFLFVVMKMFWNYVIVMVAQLGLYTNNQWIILFFFAFY